jgi:hypothetical protein
MDFEWHAIRLCPKGMQRQSSEVLLGDVASTCDERNNADARAPRLSLYPIYPVRTHDSY